MNTIADVEHLLGRARLAPYLAATGGDVAAAEDLYHWNTMLAGAIHAQLCHVEVLVRNAMDRALSDWCQTEGHPREWTQAQSTPELLYKASGKAILLARGRAAGSAHARDKNHHRHGEAPTHDDVIAQLTFGNWSFLLGATARGLEKRRAQELWTRALSPAFPDAYQDDRGRMFVGQRMERLRNLRNRVSHHENLINVDVDHRLRDMNTLLSSVRSDYPAWAMSRSRVRAVAKLDPRLSS